MITNKLSIDDDITRQVNHFNNVKGIEATNKATYNFKESGCNITVKCIIKINKVN